MLGSLLSAALVYACRNIIEPYYFMPLLVGLLCVPVWTLLNQFEATARAFGWVHVAYIPGYILRPLLLLAFVGGLVLFGGTADAVGRAVGDDRSLRCRCAGAGASGLRRRPPALRPEAKPAFHTRHWFATSLSFLMIDGFRMVLDNTDVLLIGWLLDPHSVAIYFAAIRTGGLVAFVSFSMIALAVPKFAEIHSTGTRQELQKFVSEVIQLMFWPSLLTAIALACLGPFVLSLFGADFTMGYPTLLMVLSRSRAARGLGPGRIPAQHDGPSPRYDAGLRARRAGQCRIESSAHPGVRHPGRGDRDLHARCWAATSVCMSWSRSAWA